MKTLILIILSTKELILLIIRRKKPISFIYNLADSIWFFLYIYNKNADPKLTIGLIN